MISKNLKTTSCLLLSACLAVTVNGQVINSQNGRLQCGLLNDNIYCFGGAGSSTDNTLNIIMLNLKNNDGKQVDYLNSQWSVIKSNPSNISLENRFNFQATVLPTGTQMLISGGYNLNRNVSMADQTIVYDATKNIWTKGSNYFEESIGYRQIFAASSVYIPSKGVAYFGGQEEHANASVNLVTTLGANGTTTSGGLSTTSPIPLIDNGLTRIAGYLQLTLYDAKNNIWSVPTPQSRLPQVHSFYQTSIYDPTSKNVYFFGGYYYDTSLPNFDLNSPSKHSFSYAVTFDSLTGNWGTQNFTGIAIPTSRAFHTTTLFPSSGRNVLLYGGSNGVTESSDYCYTLDLFTREWSQQKIESPYSVPMTRSRHAAVLVNDDQVFIISGTAASNDRLIILDVTLPSYVTLSNTYSIKSSDGGSFKATSDESSSNKVETIAAAVASVACFLITVAAILFWYFRRRRARASRYATEEERYREQPTQQNQQAQPGQQNYSEAPPPPYVPPRPQQEEPEFNFKNFSNVKSKYLSDCDDYDQKLRTPMYHHGKASSSSRPEEFDLGFDGDKKEAMPSTSGESSYSANKPNEMNDRKL